ncbi:response regulator [Desulfococcaceae bacterium HSG7]|nr:response regulator [Desulfococcaceae bacterium HSG7]
MNEPSSKPKILIVDDAPENLRILIEILKDEYAIIPATSGKVALQKAQIAPIPDLILLDILMPVMDGYEVCKRLKENEITKDIPVICITAMSEVMDDAKAFALGAADYIPKPFNPATVKARVKNHIKLKNALSKQKKLIKELKEALSKIKTLNGLLPICASCKKIRDDKGYWNQVEHYIMDHSDADFTHSICPECVKELYPKIQERILNKT